MVSPSPSTGHRVIAVDDDITTRSILSGMLTGRDEDSAKAAAFDVGADDYLTKSCDWQQLISTVHRHTLGVSTASHPIS